jgi:hypothetical protein
MSKQNEKTTPLPANPFTWIYTDTGEILIFKKGGVGEPIFTGEVIK